MPSPFSELLAGVQECEKSVFGESATYTPKNSAVAPYAITGIFNNRHQLVDPDTEQPIDSTIPTFGVKISDMPALPEKGDLIEIRGQNYRVHSSQEDGEGWTELLLYEVE